MLQEEFYRALTFRDKGCNADLIWCVKIHRKLLVATLFIMLQILSN